MQASPGSGSGNTVAAYGASTSANYFYGEDNLGVTSYSVLEDANYYYTIHTFDGSGYFSSLTAVEENSGDIASLYAATSGTTTLALSNLYATMTPPSGGEVLTYGFHTLYAYAETSSDTKSGTYHSGYAYTGTGTWA